MASYEGAMRAAGATVHAFREFGSYQGDWYAKVSYAGQNGWVDGSYGSCSGCDALQSEFDGAEPEEIFDDWRTSWRRDDESGTREQWKSEVESFNLRYAEFGRSYLDGMITQREAEAKAAENMEWDSEAPSMLAFIQSEAW